MIINITGGKPRQKELVRSMVKFAHKKLMPRMQNLELNIRIKDFGKDDSYGYCLPSDDTDTARPREFDVDININQRQRRLLETVAHEMVHVKQFARGELYESVAQGRHRWQGEWLSNRSKSVMDYYDQPWEIEAHGREVGLFIRWAECNGYGKYKWCKDT